MEISHTIELITIAAYLVLMISVGFVFNRFNINTDDYFRNGCKGTWWLVGMSTFMISFTAWTFTGAAGAAFESGWTVLFIYLGGPVGFLFCGLFIAPWYRQLRIVTVPEVYYLRYNELTRQFIAYLFFTSSFLFGGLTLFGLSIFISAIFGINLQAVILVLGAVVVVYSMSGGSWAVMATDFIQGAILLPLTVLVGLLSLHAVGGIHGLLEGIRAASLVEEYTALKTDLSMWAPYSVFWGFLIMIHNALNILNFNAAARYAAVKTGRDASKSCYLSAGLLLVGAFVWMIPPMVGRLLYSTEILAADITKPSEAAYAIVALKLLPPGLTGLMAVAIFSATMSNLDTSLNRNAAILIKDIYPILSRALGRIPSGNQSRLVMASRISTFLLGLLIIGIALYFSYSSQHGIFNTMLNLMVALGAPVLPSALLGLFLRRIHAYGAIASIAVGWIPAFLGVFSEPIFGVSWGYQARLLSVVSVSTIVFLGSGIFWRYTSESYREKVTLFFKRRDTPIQFREEVGASTDFTQLKILGLYTIIIGFGILILALIPDEAKDRLITLTYGSVVFTLGMLMSILGRRGKDS